MVVDVVVVDGFVLNRRLFSVVHSLQLMTIGEIGVVRGRDDIVLVVSLSCEPLVLGCGFEMVRGRAMMLCGAVMNLVFVCSRHSEDPDFVWNDKGMPKRSRPVGNPVGSKPYLSRSPSSPSIIQRVDFGYRVNPFLDIKGVDF